MFEELFKTQVIVNEEEFNELMQILEANTNIRWLGSNVLPTEYTPKTLAKNGFIVIPFWGHPVLSFYDETVEEWPIVSFEEVKQILTSEKE